MEYYSWAKNSPNAKKKKEKKNNKKSNCLQKYKKIKTVNIYWKFYVSATILRAFLVFTTSLWVDGKGYVLAIINSLGKVVRVRNGVGTVPGTHEVLGKC